MVPKLNYLLMVVLITGLLAGVTALAVSGAKTKPAPSDLRLSALINRLGFEDMEVVRDARHDLISFGKDAMPRLTQALSHENKQVREQARLAVDVIEGRKTEAQIEP